jgi:hypothetical protein
MRIGGTMRATTDIDEGNDINGRGPNTGIARGAGSPCNSRSNPVPE